MINNKRILGIIPARGGSKEIPKKNIKRMLGVPLISRSIREIKKSNYIDKIIVSTDSKEIADIALKEKVEIPFIRPSRLSNDNSTASEVILHALNWFRVRKKEHYDFFIYLQPTSPFRTVYDIDKSIELFILNNDSESLVSVKSVSEHPDWMKIKNKSGFLVDFIKNNKNISIRQSLSKILLLNGAIYISKWNFFLEHKSFYKGNCIPYIMDKRSSLDIDTVDDWNYAEYILSNLN